MTDQRKTLLLLSGIALAAIFGCSLGCLFAIRLSGCMCKAQAHPGGSHEWLHQQLGITEEQDKALEAVEAKFAKREEELNARLSRANAELGRLLKEDRSYSPRVEASVDEIHHAMAELQKATIEHLIDMGDVLSAGQFSRLLEVTSDALSE